ncbi:HEXXH motif-containing protein [Williamsia serinedens]|uniref:HEXXH motif-containing protein n=2 Tax=Williamsia serinedens TaxID=391736 RepID=A0ABT1GW95_9NOCA|nr:HEXXH motif-containing protein [Williamsia serinedens]
MALTNLVPALLGRIDPEPVRVAWAEREFALRLETYGAASPLPESQLAPPEAIRKVFSHPAVGSMARAGSAAPKHWAPVVAALQLLAGDEVGAIAALRSRGVLTAGGVHLPGTASVWDHSAKTMRALEVVNGFELNNIEPAFNAWSDHVDPNITGEWRALVSDSAALIAELDNRDFINATALTTVVVPLLQRDGKAYGRTSKFEIESGSLTDAVGMAYISPGTWDRVSFAEAMVHESYHSLFNMALELCEFELENEAEFYAPWKGATRPTRAVLHGIVAFSAVMRFWIHLSKTRSVASTRANELISRRANQVLQSATAVLAAGVLTSAGEELAEAAVEDARAACS